MRPIFKIFIAAIILGLTGYARAATPPCTGNVVIGEGDPKIVTNVANKSVNGVCINALVVDTAAEGASYGNHGEFVSQVSKLVREWTNAGHITVNEAGELMAAAARSHVGKTTTVRIIAFNDFHGNIDGANLTLRSDPDGICIRNAAGQCAQAVPSGGVDYMAGLVRQLKEGFPGYGVKEFKGKISVAFIGMTLKGTPSIVTPSGVAGLEFRDEAETVNALVGDLKRRGIEAVVVLLHEGGVAPGSINGCSGVSGAIVDIVKRLDDAVDMVISAHTHQAYNCDLPNRVNRPIPVTSAGAFSRLVTAID